MPSTAAVPRLGGLDRARGWMRSALALGGIALGALTAILIILD